MLCLFRRAKDRHNLLYCSPLLKKTCVRQVALDDKSFPPRAEDELRVVLLVGGVPGLGHVPLEGLGTLLCVVFVVISL